VARLNVISDSVNALKKLRALSYDEFVREHILVGSAERDFQVAIQAALDIGAQLLSESGAQTPTEYSDIFRTMGRVGILPQSFAEKLVYMAKFRNVLVHLYLEVDLKKVYQYIQNDLDDFVTFAKFIGDYMETKKEI